MADSKFLKIDCPRCGHKQIVYGKASINVKCEKCNYLLSKPRGGKAKVRGKITKIL